MACRPIEKPVPSLTGPPPNEELRAIYEQDQADRLNLEVAGGWPAVAERDRERHRRVQELIASGGLSAGEDYFHAAMVFQHGATLDSYWQAHELAKTAADLGESRGRWLAAAAYDRWLVNQGKPQKYGTQYRERNGRYELHDLDPATTDNERAAWDVPALAVAKLMAEQLTAKGDATAALLQEPPLAELTVPGLTVQIKLWLGPNPPANRPKQQPKPLEPGEGVLPSYLPPGLSPRRLGSGYCAVDASGEWPVAWSHSQLESGVYVNGWFKDSGPPPPLEPVETANRVAIWIGGNGTTPAQVIVRITESSCWRVTGTIARDELVRVAASLPLDRIVS